MNSVMRMACLIGLILGSEHAFCGLIQEKKNATSVFGQIGNVIAGVELGQFFASAFYACIWTGVLGWVIPFPEAKKWLRAPMFLAITSRYVNEYYKENLREKNTKKI